MSRPAVPGAMLTLPVVTGYDRAYSGRPGAQPRFYHYTTTQRCEIAALWRLKAISGLVAEDPAEPDGSESAKEVLDSKIFVTTG